MALIPPQSETLKKYRYLDEYNDVGQGHDVRQVASNLVKKTIMFAKLCFYEENGVPYQINDKFTAMEWKEVWPSTDEFTIFSAFPKIEAFMNIKYQWLQSWPHSIQYVKEIIASDFISFHVYEICYGAARVSYPVTQTTFSIYFVFEVNMLAKTECSVRYFLEETDEQLIPFNNDKITLPQIKSLMKKKLALSALILLGSQPVVKDNVFEDNLKKLIQKKKEMLQEIRFETNIVKVDNITPFPCKVHVQMKKKCRLHRKECPVLHEAHQQTPYSEFTYEDYMRTLKPIIKISKEKDLETLSDQSVASNHSDSSIINDKHNKPSEKLGLKSSSLSFESYYGKHQLHKINDNN